jgi:hypothetical protein
LWINVNEPDWLTPYGICELLALSKEEEENTTGRKFRSRVIRVVKDLLRNADTNPVVLVSLVTAPRYMEYIFQLPNKKRPNSYLSKLHMGIHGWR